MVADSRCCVELLYVVEERKKKRRKRKRLDGLFCSWRREYGSCIVVEVLAGYGVEGVTVERRQEYAGHVPSEVQ